MRPAALRRNAVLQLLVGLIVLSLAGATMTAPSAQAWVAPLTDNASF